MHISLYIIFFILIFTSEARAAYLPTTGSNIGIGTSTPVGGFVVMNGNVGIGTWSPDAGFVIANTTAPSMKLIRAGVGSYSISLSNVMAGDTGDIWFAPLQTSSGFAFHAGNNFGMGMSRTGSVGIGTTSPVGGTAIMNGNVGIGTWSPVGALEVKGLSATRIWTGAGTDTNATGAGELYVEGDLEVDGTIYGDGSGITALPSTLAAGGWVDGGTNVYQTTTSDNVGIGTTAPVAALDITSAADQDLLRINDNGAGDTSPFVVSSTGNVGIGTPYPSYTLDIGSLTTIGTSRLYYGSGGVSLNLQSNVASASAVEFYDGPTAGTLRGRIRYYNSSNATTPNQMAFAVGGSSEKMFINSAGNVGIGSISPLALLDVAGSAMLRGAPGQAGLVVTAAGNVGMGTLSPVGGLTVMNGNVGIGTWSPVGALEVKGLSATRIWTGGGTDTNATGAGELYVEGDLEVDGTIYGDGSGITALAATLPAGGWTDGGTNVFTTASTDNVGIGTTSPQAFFEVTSTAGRDLLRINDNGAGDSTPFVIDSNGYVGIGTTVATGMVSISNQGSLPTLFIEDKASVDDTPFVIDSAGNVGIGTGDVNAKLAVVSPDTSGEQILQKWIYDPAHPASYSLDLKQTVTAGNVRWNFAQVNNAASYDNVMVFDRGNVGIGTAYPAGRLIVWTGNVGIGTSTPVGGTAIMNGNVGIGTWNPAAALYVRGDIVATGTGATPLTLQRTATHVNLWDFTISTHTGYDSGSLIVEPQTAEADLIFRDFGNTVTMALDNSLNNVHIPNGSLGIGTTLASAATGLAVMNGNVGIGTWSPNNGLEVKGVNAAVLSTGGTNTNATGAGELYVQGDLEVDGTIYGDGSGITALPAGLAAGGWTDSGTAVSLTTDTDRVGLGTTLMSAGTGLAVMNGNVGIGTWAPETLLHVAANGAALKLGDGSNTSSYMQFATNNAGSASRMQIGYDGNNALVQSGAAKGLKFLVNSNTFASGGTAAIMISTAGNVGVGTTAPVGALTVMSGNVGIGTWSPVGALEVKGLSATRIWTGTGTDTNATGAGELYVEGDLEVDGTIYGDGSGITALPTTLAAGGWVDGGTNVYQTTTTDNVGIGTTTPATTLEVVKSSNRAPLMVSSSAAGAGDFLKIDSAGNIGIGTTLTTTGALSIMNGNVGIGTWKPAAAADIVGTLTTTDVTGVVKGAVVLGAASASYGIVGYNANPQNSINTYRYISNDYSSWVHFANGGINFYTAASGTAGNIISGVSRFNISNGGNIGIGTDMTSAAAKFVVNSGNVGIGTIIPVNGTAIMNGNVGIGTWSPVGALEVKGLSATRIWTGTGTDTNATGAGELYVEGDLEVDGTIYGDGSGITALPAGLAAGGWTDGGTAVSLTTDTDRVGLGTTLMSAGTGLAVMNGNVGIGTWAPNKPFVVGRNSTAGTTSYLATFKSTIGTSTHIQIESPSSVSHSIVLSSLDSGLDSISVPSGDTLLLSGGAATALQAWEAGIGYYTKLYADNRNIGIGTNVPSTTHATLEVINSPGNPAFMVSSTTARPGDYISVDSAGNIGIGTTTPAGALTVLSGNVGIGTWNPAVGLDVIKSGTQLRLGYDAANYAAFNVDSSGGTTLTISTAGGDIAVNPNGTLSLGTSLADNILLGRTDWNSFGYMALRAGGDTMRLVSNNVGIGTIKPVSKLAVNGGVGIGTTNASTFLDNPAPSGGLIVEGRVGIGTVVPVGALAVMNGNVGIGTWSPVGALEVKGLSATRIWTGTGTDTNATGAGELYVEGDLEVDGTIYGDGSGITALPTTLAAGGWTDGGTNIYQTATSDNVGIGTTSPNTVLEVTSTAAYDLFRINDNGTGDSTPFVVTSTGNVGLGTSSLSAKLAIIGNVGIGTASPSTKLDIDAQGEVMRMGDYTNADTYIGVQSNGASPRAAFGYGNAQYGGDQGSAVVQATTGKGISFGSGTAFDASTLMYMNSDGNFGIGTTTPAGALTVLSGNVGIGTWKPIGTLDVKGLSATRIWTGAGTDTNATGAGELYVEGDLEVDGTIYGDGSGITALPAGLAAGGWTDAGSTVNLTTDTDRVGLGTTLTAAGTALSIMNGNVGIGTWSPNARLQIAAGDILLDNATALKFKDASGGVQSIIQYSSSNNTTVSAGSNNDVMLVSGTTLIAKGASGHVGLGTSQPPGKLSVLSGGTTLPAFVIHQIPSATANSMEVRDSTGVKTFVINESGNVGLGTATPVGALTVMNGNVGVGTWSPTSRLQVIGDVSVADEAYGGTWDGSANVPTKNAVYDQVQSLILGGAGGWIDGGTNIYNFNTDDNIGIGTTSPSTTLEIVKQSNRVALMVSSAPSGDGDFLKIDSAGNVGVGTTDTASGALSIMNGPVGIGTWKPLYPLTVERGSSSFSAVFRSTSSNYVSVWAGSTSSAGYHFGEAGQGTRGAINYANSSGLMTFGTAASGSAVDRMAITGAGSVGIGTTTPVGGTAIMNGNVGIGTWSPRYGLDINGSIGIANSSGGVEIQGYGENAMNLYTEGSMYFRIDSNANSSNLYYFLNGAGGTIMQIDELGSIGIGTTLNSATTGLSVMNGNVGIGTWSPNYALDVIGSARFSSFIYQPSVYNAIKAYDTTGLGLYDQTGNSTRGISIQHGGNVGIGTNQPVGGLVIMNGNVGIGTWSPDTKLQVVGTISSGIYTNTQGQLTLHGGGASQPDLNITGFNSGIAQINTSSGSDRQLQIINTGAKTLGLYVQGNVGIGTVTPVAGLSVMNGNVGIGTWSPNAQLEVKGGNASIISTGGTNTNATGAGELYVQGDLEVDGTIYGDGSGITALPAGLAAGGWTDGGTNVYSSDTTDNVGIGTTSPATTFEIVKQSARAPLMVSSSPTGAGDFLFVDSSGNIGVGTSSPRGAFVVMNGGVGIGTTDPGTDLIKIRQGTTDRFRISSSGGVVVGGAMTAVGIISTGNSFQVTSQNPAYINVRSLGIGTANPVNKLSVNGGVGIGTTDSSNFVDMPAPSGGMIIEGAVGIGTVSPVGGLTVMNGNVGIGTWSPVAALEIKDGTLRLTGSGNLQIGGGNTVIDSNRNLFNLSGTVRAGAGNALQFQTNAGNTTWLYISTAGNVGIGTVNPVNGTAIMNGNVGIGTWSPVGALEVRGGAAATRIWTGAGTDTNATSAGELYVEGDLEVDGTIYGDGSGITALPSTLAAGGWTDGGTNVYTSATTDNVGIGTTSPVATLDITSMAANDLLRVNDNGPGDTTPFVIDSTGNVGVGTAGPSAYNLRVNGSTRSVFFYGDAGGGFRGDTFGTYGWMNANTTIRPQTGYNLHLAPSDGNVGIGTTMPVNGTVIMNGNVGIGTWSPNNGLEVKGVNAAVISTGGTNTNATGAGELYVQGDLEVDGTIYGDGSGITALPAGLAAGGWTDGGTNVYTTTTTDNVGIGTTSPVATLDITSTAANDLFRVNDNGVGDTSPFIIDSTGNVGIGTASPRAVLDVSGTNGSKPFVMATGGNVGVGTARPGAILDIYAGSNGDTVRAANGAGSHMWSLSRQGTVATGDLSVSAYGGIGFTGGKLTAPEASAFKMYISPVGNVGVGTTTPVAGLAVMNGNVGIGTWSPNNGLEVKGVNAAVISTGGTNTNATGAGELYVQGDLEVDGTIYGDGSGITALPAGLAAGGWTDSGTAVSLTTDTDRVGIGTTLMSAGTALSIMNGNVGIGTWATIAPLTIKGGNIEVFGAVIAENDNAFRGGSVYLTSGSQIKSSIQSTGSPYDMIFNVPNGSERMRIANTGNVGIGTVNPLALLATGPGNVGIGTIYPVNGTAIMNGNVGIGTWSPTAQLQVVGTVNASGNVGVGDSITDSSNNPRVTITGSKVEINLE